MFRLQGIAVLPWDFQVSANMDFSSGKATTRQIRVAGLGQVQSDVIMEPGGVNRFPEVRNVDLLVGKGIPLRGNAAIRLEAWVLNLLNDDQALSYATLRLQNPSETFVPDAWVHPRRLQLRVGFQF